WHQAIQQHLSPDDIYYFAVYDGDLPLAIIPLATEKKSRRGMPVVHLDFPRHRTLDCADLLVREGRAHLDILFAVLEHIRKHRILKWDLLELTRFTVRSGAFAILGVSMTLSMGACSAYMVSDETGTLLSKLSKKQIKNTQRQLKKAESDYGSVSFTHFHQPQQILQAYATFLAVEAAGWKGEQGTKSALRLQN